MRMVAILRHATRSARAKKSTRRATENDDEKNSELRCAHLQTISAFKEHTSLDVKSDVLKEKSIIFFFSVRFGSTKEQRSRETLGSNFDESEEIDRTTQLIVN